MKSLNCKNCGAAMYFDSSAMKASCRFCKTEHMLSMEDNDFFHDYYSALTDLLSPVRDELEKKKKADAVWEKAESVVFKCNDGTDVEIRYLHCHEIQGVTVYTARRNLVFHFKAGEVDKTELYRKVSSMVDYPSADIRMLSNFFPNVVGGFSLYDGSNILIISKDENEYPLRLFTNLSGRHTAWIISRIENLCCVLEYNCIVHPLLGIDTIYINPYLHQASLYGGWWAAGKKNTYSSYGRVYLTMESNLIALRKTAANVLGFAGNEQVRNYDGIPKPMADFISGSPKTDAYADFTFWDEVLIKSYGERKFIDFEADDEKIYNKG